MRRRLLPPPAADLPARRPGWRRSGWRARGLIVLLVVGAGVLPGCRAKAAPALRLDGSARHQNAEGVVTDATFQQVTLDGHTRLNVSPKLGAFSTAKLQAIPLLSTPGQYVLAGTSGKTLVWLATVSAVVRVPGQPPVAYYTGVVRRYAGNDVEFADGTVLHLAPSLPSARPPVGVRARATIDVQAHRVASLVPA